MTGQPVPDIDAQTVERIIGRDYPGFSAEVKEKLKHLVYDSAQGKDRISAAILKLAAGKIEDVARFVDMANGDYRDVLAWAEFPAFFRLGLDRIDTTDVNAIYASDGKQYKDWLERK